MPLYVNTTTVDAPLIAVSHLEYWQVDRSGGAVDAAIRLYWGASSNFADTLGLRIARWGGTKWAMHLPDIKNGIGLTPQHL